MRWRLTVIPVWLLTAVGALLVGLFSRPGEYLTWLPMVLAGAIFLTFCVQLAAVQKEGLVNRMTASLVGSVVVLAAATVILVPLSLA
ncbi:hypothetical protein [Parafrigoribacterium soli]|uniref:hypothetical protein n=1 Tax=Parafrigoribacterium soli TaxID=3144663 RepID=UPI0032EBE254